MNKLLFIFLSITLTLLSCSQSKEEKAFKIFNEGVTLSLKAGKYIEQGNQKQGRNNYELSIEKFKETLLIDSNHKGAPSALGHNFYEIREYDEAIDWFKKAIKVQPDFAVSYQFLGLSQINKGNIEEGEKNIEKALEMDNSKDMINNTISNLVYIGNLAYSYGDEYEKEGKISQGNDYRKFGIRVLISALNYSENDKKIGEMIKEYASKMNDETMTTWIIERMDKDNKS